MLANKIFLKFLNLVLYTVVMITSIDLSQSILAINVLTAFYNPLWIVTMRSLQPFIYRYSLKVPAQAIGNVAKHSFV